MEESQNIFLVGMMGAGKSTVGKLLARRLGMSFFDADHEIEARTGVKIPVIFEVEGEAGFRKRECDVVDALTQGSNVVVATGGGAVLDAGTRAHLKSRGFTIYLSSSVQELWQRTRNDRGRPMLQTQDPYARLQHLMQFREPLYMEVAHMVIETGRPSVGKLVERIIREMAARPECGKLISSMPASTSDSASIDPND